MWNGRGTNENNSEQKNAKYDSYTYIDIQGQFNNSIDANYLV